MRGFHWILFLGLLLVIQVRGSTSGVAETADSSETESWESWESWEDEMGKLVDDYSEVDALNDSDSESISSEEEDVNGVEALSPNDEENKRCWWWWMMG